jgi:hypothetical protein
LPTRPSSITAEPSNPRWWTGSQNGLALRLVDAHRLGAGDGVRDRADEAIWILGVREVA